MAPVAAWLRRRLRSLFPRSNGIAVRRSTARCISIGDQARRAQDWAGAAIGYRAALDAQPGLRHIWMQLGHALKEDGRPDEAAIAYRRCAELDDRDPEPFGHLGHMAKGDGRYVEAAAHFVEVLRRAPGDLPATAELVRLMPMRSEAGDGLWHDAVVCLGLDPAVVARQTPLPVDAVLCDVTDLVAYLSRRRLPSGIQRVQLELSMACLSPLVDVPVVFCVYAPLRRTWLTVPAGAFAGLCRASVGSADEQDRAWTAQLLGFYRQVAVGAEVPFNAGRILLNLGTSWADRSYLDAVAAARQAHGIVYVAFVFDLIPWLRPDWFVPTLVDDFTQWLRALLSSADGFLAISQSTRRDLLAAAAAMRQPLAEDRVRVVRLDGDLRSLPGRAAPNAPGRKLPPRFVLFVSTIEPRKNHVGAFRAWRLLVDRLDLAAMPTLVCVGGAGWLNEDVHQLLSDDAVLAGRVRILSDVADDELARLYAGCLFVLYPSFYEGWGLPVSEALSHGKVPAISRTSSMPEAGGRFARYFDPDDPATIADTVAALLDDAIRHEAEAAIRDGYRPRAWADIASQTIAAARTIAAAVRISGSAAT